MRREDILILDGEGVSDSTATLLTVMRKTSLVTPQSDSLSIRQILKHKNLLALTAYVTGLSRN